MSLLQKRIVIVTGKGGVGKSTLAAALAHKAAVSGKRALLVELGEQSFYAPFFGLQNVSYHPQKVNPLGFEVALWDTESCLREYVLYYIRVQSLFKIFFENRVMRTFINVAPALKELAVMGKLTSGERQVGPEFHYDIIIVDGYATGHMLALLRAPKGMSETIPGGPMGHHSKQIHQVLTNPDITGYAIATVPDELPTVEALELNAVLHAEFQVSPQIFINRVLHSPFSIEDLEKFENDSTLPNGLKLFARFLRVVSCRQAQNIQKLSSVAPTQIIPIMTEAKDTTKLLQQIAEVF